MFGPFRVNICLQCEAPSCCFQLPGESEPGCLGSLEETKGSPPPFVRTYLFTIGKQGACLSPDLFSFKELQPKSSRDPAQRVLFPALPQPCCPVPRTCFLLLEASFAVIPACQGPKNTDQSSVSPSCVERDRQLGFQLCSVLLG